MPVARHQFAQLDTDSDASIKAPSSFDSARNISLEPGFVTAVAGNVAVPYALPTGANVRLGGFEDGSTGTAVSLLYNAAGAHRLIRYDPLGNAGAGSETTLLEWAGLNLSAEMALHGGVLDGLFIYLDAAGTLRSVPLARAAAGEYTPARLLAEPYALHLVKAPPTTTLMPSRNGTVPGDPQALLRVIQNKAYQFSYRWRYAGGETTVLAPFSEWLDVVKDPATTTDTVIQMPVPVAPPGVNEVEMLVREPDSPAWVVAAVLHRDAAGELPFQYAFYGLVEGAALTVAEGIKPFESEWPARAAGIARGRVFKGGLTEGYLSATPAFTVEVGFGNAYPLEARTFHENTSYRVAAQFYDALGIAFGVSTAQTIRVPVRATGSTATRSLLITLTTPASGQSAEIPAEAASYQFLIARNDRTVEFRTGQAANHLSFVGYERVINADGRVKETATLIASTAAHERLWIDIGNWPAAGQGYVWQPGSGDMLRFLADDVEFPITGQYGDYVEVAWKGVPSEARPMIEIYTPNTTAANVFYERGPRFPILRTGEERRYSVESLGLAGDCFLIALSFPTLVFDSAYAPPDKKRYIAAPAPVTVESMVPLHRLVTRTATTTTRFAAGTIGDQALNEQGFIASRFGTAANLDRLRGENGLGTTTLAVVGQTTEWLDMSRGGRVGVLVPLALQRVERPALVRFSGVKVAGTQLNGLSQWDALNQFDELPQEQGGVTRLTVADQTQTDGSILLVNQQRGDVSLSLGQARIQTADDQPLLAITKSVIGGANALRGGFGCTDPASVVAYAGKVFFWCARRAELLRYDRNGLTPLGLTYKARVRLEALARAYAGARVRGCYDPRRKEYLLTFDAAHGQPATTLVYSERQQAWADALSYAPEAGLGVGNELTTWAGAVLYRHRPDAPAATFAGVYTAPQLTFSVAAPGGVAKHFLDAAVESPTLWLPTALATDTAQVSRMLPAWFVFREGVHRAGLRRDETSPGFATVYHALSDGLPLIGARLTVTLTADVGAAPLTAVSVSYKPRSGQQMGL